MKLNWWRTAALLYLALLAASTLVRWSKPDVSAAPRLGVRSFMVNEVAGDPPRELEAAPVTITYLEWPRFPAPAEAAGNEARAADLAQAEALPLILIHGSPGSASNFIRMAPHLARHRDVYALDLPGFGYAERDVADYSISAHAVYLRQFMDRLEIDRAHLLGFSMGGGVILHLGDRHPDRVASQTLLAAIGVQEFELLGNYTLNHLVHGVQLWGLRALRTLVPHFGTFDGGMLSEQYARNFYDTDQRPLRRLLRRWQGPMLILHGEGDPLVPAGAAREHHRLVPQSELAMRSDSHFFVFRKPAETAATIADFLARVENGAALTRDRASTARVQAAGAPFDPSVLTPWTGPALLVVLPLIAFATFLSEDLTCVAAGMLATQGRISLLAAILACYVGIVVGDVLLFWLGRRLGRPVVRRAPLRWWISEQALEDSSRWLAQRGALVVLLSRFLPGARLPTNLAAGVLRTRAPAFLLYFSIAGLLWTPLIVWLSAELGEKLLPRLAGVRGSLAIAALLLVTLIWLVRRFLVPLLTHRGRRKLYGLIERWRHWEFWPWWLIYPPVILAILRAGLRHRGLLLFTAVNPALPAGGFVGESKSDILRRLPEHVIPAWRVVPALGSRFDLPRRQQEVLDAVHELQHDHQLGYPLVIKPDRGERGDGVEIVRSEEEIRAYVEAMANSRRFRDVPLIIQAYATGVEFGVFWARGPRDPEGQLLSINEKRRPAVRGDGRRSLETLILDDPRAAALIETYRHEHPNAATWIPASGEEVCLVEVGAHKRGTIFLDARELASPELRAAIQRIVDAFEGEFDFGRLDVKAPSVEHFVAGRDLQVLEVNGVTSEVAHVYDRRFSLRRAVSDLSSQWRECYRIGAQRRELGQPVWSWAQFLRLLIRRRPEE